MKNSKDFDKFYYHVHPITVMFYNVAFLYLYRSWFNSDTGDFLLFIVWASFTYFVHLIGDKEWGTSN